MSSLRKSVLWRAGVVADYFIFMGCCLWCMQLLCCCYVVAMSLLCDCLLQNQTKSELKNSIKFKDSLRSVRCARLWIFWPRPKRKWWSSSCGACSWGGCKASVAKVWWNNCRHERELYAVDAITWGRREENISPCGQNICVGPVKGGWGEVKSWRPCTICSLEDLTRGW